MASYGTSSRAGGSEMVCNKCKEIQAQNLKGKSCAYLRVGNANVLIGACDEHFNKLRDRYCGVYPDRRVIRFN